MSLNRSGEYRVVVHLNGRAVDIGSVVEDRESSARLAALSLYGMNHCRPGRDDDPPGIYLDDDFDVRPS